MKVFRSQLQWHLNSVLQMASNSRATRRPDSEVPATSTRHTRVQSSTTAGTRLKVASEEAVYLHTRLTGGCQRSGQGETQVHASAAFVEVPFGPSTPQCVRQGTHLGCPGLYRGRQARDQCISAGACQNRDRRSTSRRSSGQPFDRLAETHNH